MEYFRLDYDMFDEKEKKILKEIESYEKQKKATDYLHIIISFSWITFLLYNIFLETDIPGLIKILAYLPLAAGFPYIILRKRLLLKTGSMMKKLAARIEKLEGAKKQS